MEGALEDDDADGQSDDRRERIDILPRIEQTESGIGDRQLQIEQHELERVDLRRTDQNAERDEKEHARDPEP